MQLKVSEESILADCLREQKIMAQFKFKPKATTFQK